MGATPRPRKAGGKRPKRKVQHPARYSHDYPVKDGHNYWLRSVPGDIWSRARRRALSEERSIRGVLIDALQRYAAGDA